MMAQLSKCATKPKIFIDLYQKKCTVPWTTCKASSHTHTNIHLCHHLQSASILSFIMNIHHNLKVKANVCEYSSQSPYEFDIISSFSIVETEPPRVN